MVEKLARVRDELLHEVKSGVETSGAKKRDAQNDAGLMTYRAGDFVLVARPRKHAKLAGVWTGPWRVVLEARHVYTVEDLLSSERVKTHVSRMRSYADSSLDVTVELKEVASRIRLQGELKMDDILDTGPLDDGTDSVVVEWQGLGASWEAVSKIYEDAPKFLERKLIRTGIPASVNKELRSLCGMRL